MPNRDELFEVNGGKKNAAKPADEIAILDPKEVGELYNIIDAAMNETSKNKLVDELAFYLWGHLKEAEYEFGPIHYDAAEALVNDGWVTGVPDVKEEE